MSREQQIEEMAMTICESTAISCYETAIEIAEHLISAKGYRKASEVAREIFSEIETIFDEMIDEATDQLSSSRLECDLKAVKIMEYGIDVMHLVYRTLKRSLEKKYTEEGE